MKLPPRYVVLTLLSLGLFNVARAQFSAVYDFGTTLSDVPLVANAAFNPLTATNVSITRLSTGQASSSSWVTSGAAADTSEYVSLSFQAAPSHELEVTSLSFKSSHSTTGPISFSVALFVGGSFKETSSAFTSSSTSTTTSSMPTFTFDFTDVGGIVSASLVEFRFYGWGGSGSTGVLRFDNIAINGSVSAIPEPVTYPLLCGASALALATLRRFRVRNVSTTAKPAFSG